MRAYPRAGGGTELGMTVLLDVEGLSPRGRGNLEDVGDLARGLGPIPARAGEPRAGESAPAPQWAYPRAGGGTVFQERYFAFG